MAYLADRCGFYCSCAAGFLALISFSSARAETIAGDQLALRSTGSGSLGDWTIDRNGYVGTYIELPTEGQVTIRVNASGTPSGGVDPHMNIVVADTKAGFHVVGGFNDYESVFDLPAGTYFVRAELNNDLEASSRQLTIRDLTVDGATLLNASTNGNALAAADTYIEHFRRGNAKVALSGLAPGSSVDVRLKRHEFNFGTAIPNSFSDTFLIANPTPGSTAANFQQALADSRFNSLTAENGAKWDANEGNGSVGGRDALTSNAVNPNGGPNIPYMDRISDYAQEHGMRYRAHNLIWGPNNQQPPWVVTMLNNPNATDTYNASTNPHGTNLTNRNALFSDLVAPAGTPNAGEPSEIHERIDYYIRDRAQRFYEIDVYNESYHTGSNAFGSNNYWDIFGPSGIAAIYKASKDAIADAGSNARTFINEYNVLENQGGDFFANWYLRHFETLQNAGRTAFGEDVVDGIGFQYYADSGAGTAHNPARIYAVMQNLAVSGLPMHLTEFGISTDTPDQNTQANILSESLRLVFGMPDTTGFTMWGFWAGSVWSQAPNGVLYNSDWTLRPAGVAWNDLQDQWNTELSLQVGPDGTIDFTGFYGDYEILVDGVPYDLTLTKGDSLYSIPIAPGDYNGDGQVDAGDYVTWRNTLGTDDLRADGDGDGLIGIGDYDVWKAAYGTSYGPGSGQLSGTVPEPSTLILLWSVAGCSLLPRWRRPPQGTIH